VTDLPLALEINYFRLVGDHYFACAVPDARDSRECRS
jgi:hypothetical protein